MDHSRHSQGRIQQRGISTEGVNVVLKYGRRRYGHEGIICEMDKRSRLRART